MRSTSLMTLALVVLTPSLWAQPSGPRLIAEKPVGQRIKLSLGTLFLPQALPDQGKVPLFLHFHGPGWIAEVAAARKENLAVLHAQLGTGSAVYGKPFQDPKRLQELLEEAEAKSGRTFELVGLTGWSAGYGAIRAILRQQTYYRQVRWVILLDGLHAGYTSERRPIEADLDCYLQLARDAATGAKRFLITHTRIVPGKYASTTETADLLLEKTGVKRDKQVLDIGLPGESGAHQGGLTVLGCAGADAAAHIDHLHALPRLVQTITTGTADAVVVDDVALVQTTQLVPVPRIDGKKPDEQIQALLKQLQRQLRLVRSDLEKVVRLHVYATSQDVVPVIHEALARTYPGTKKPALTVVVGTPVEEGVQVSLDAVALSGLPGKSGTATMVVPEKRSRDVEAPLAVLPAGPAYYISGQAERGKTLAESTQKTLHSLDATLRGLGRSKEDIVQVKAFVHPMKQIADVRKEIRAYFGELRMPPVSLVEWTFADSIEIELVVAGAPGKEKAADAVDFLTPEGMKPSPVFSRVARINRGKRLYTSGITGIGTDGAAQVKNAYAQLNGILKRHSSDMRHLVKATYYVSTDDASKQLNVLRPNYYDPKRPPAASKAPVRGVGRADSGLTLDLIAVIP